MQRFGFGGTKRPKTSKRQLDNAVKSYESQHALSPLQASMIKSRMMDHLNFDQVVVSDEEEEDDQYLTHNYQMDKSGDGDETGKENHSSDMPRTSKRTRTVLSDDIDQTKQNSMTSNKGKHITEISSSKLHNSQSNSDLLFKKHNLVFISGVPLSYFLLFMICSLILVGLDHSNIMLFHTKCSVFILFIPLTLVIFYLMNGIKRRNKQNAIMLSTQPDLLSLIMKEMPRWYTFKDVEQVNWFNTIIQQLWPYIDHGISTLIKEEHADGLLEKIPGIRVELDEITLGVVAPSITSVKTSHSSRGEVHLDLEVKWASDLNVSLMVGFSKFPFQLVFDSMQFSGLIRIKFTPLIPLIPFIGGIEISFLTVPHIDFSFKIGGMDAMAVSVPGVLDVATSVTGVIKRSLQEMMVYPTHLVIPIDSTHSGGGAKRDKEGPVPPAHTDRHGKNPIKFMKSLPHGIVHININKCLDLPRMDHGLRSGGGLQSSDPYVTMTVQGSEHSFKEYKTKTVKKSLNPEWEPNTSATFEVVIWDVDITEISFTVWDEDMIGSDQLIGNSSLKLKHLQSPNQKEYFSLPIKLSSKGCRDLKVINPIIQVDVQYFPCLKHEKESVNQQEDEEKEHGEFYSSPVTSELSDDSGSEEMLMNQTFQTPREKSNMLSRNIPYMGILIVKNLELFGVQSICGKSLANESLYVILESESSCMIGNHGNLGDNTRVETTKKHNKACPYKLTWLETFYFIVKNPTLHSIVLRLTVMQKCSHLNAAMGRTLHVVSFGEMDKHKDKQVGYIEISFSDLSTSGYSLESRSTNLISTTAFGEASFDCELLLNR